MLFYVEMPKDQEGKFPISDPLQETAESAMKIAVWIYDWWITDGFGLQSDVLYI